MLDRKDGELYERIPVKQHGQPMSIWKPADPSKTRKPTTPKKPAGPARTVGGHDGQAQSFDEPRAHVSAGSISHSFILEGIQGTGILQSRHDEFGPRHKTSILAAEMEDSAPVAKGYQRLTPLVARNFGPLIMCTNNSGVPGSAGVWFSGDGLGYLSAYDADTVGEAVDLQHLHFYVGTAHKLRH